jgi:hypothetical protein
MRAPIARRLAPLALAATLAGAAIPLASHATPAHADSTYCGHGSNTVHLQTWLGSAWETDDFLWSFDYYDNGDHHIHVYRVTVCAFYTCASSTIVQRGCPVHH